MCVMELDCWTIGMAMGLLISVDLQNYFKLNTFASTRVSTK